MANLLELAKEFSALRKDGKNDQVCAMCTDDVVLDHFKDGKFEGLAAYKKYIEENPAPANARTEEPVIDENDKNMVRFQGFARKLMMDWKFFIEMTFTADGKVSKIRTYR